LFAQGRYIGQNVRLINDILEQTKLQNIQVSYCNLTSKKAVELLACKLRQDKEIQGLNIFQKEIKVTQFADDTTLLNSNRNSVKRAITVLDNFGDLSGLRLNSSKTKVCGLDPGGFAKKNLSDSGGLKVCSDTWIICILRCEIKRKAQF